MNQLNLSSASPRVSKRNEAVALSWVMLLLGIVLVTASGCGLLRAPERMVTAVVPGKESQTPDPLELQVKIERYSDNFNLLTSRALDDYANKVGTEDARAEALRLKLLSMSVVTGIASGPKPHANLLELVAVVTLNRLALEERWRKAPDRSALEPWLADSRLLETNAWELAATELKPAFVEELRRTINEWSANNPDARGTLFVRPQEFAPSVADEKKRVNLHSVFSLVHLDPTSGLDPAVREITKTRLLAERALFTLQRMPLLLRLQTELLTYQLTEQPQVRLALSNTTLLANSADRISRATESVSQTAAQLPDRLSAERKEILAALDQQEGQLKDLAAQVEHVMESGATMSTSLNTTIGTFDALMKRFGVGEPAADTAPDTNSAPFNILDYGRVADRVGAMAKDVNALVNSVNQSVPQLERLSQQATADAQKVVDRGFRLGLVLIAVLLIGAVLAGLVYRVSAERLKRAAPAPQAPTR